MTTALASLALLAAVAVSDADLRERTQSIETKGGYQTTLPAGTAAPGATPPPPGAVRRRGTRAPSVGAPTAPLLALGALWPVVATVGVAVLVLAGWRLIQARRSRERPARTRTPGAVDAPARRALRIGPLTDVEDLARQGRFGEAIHLLLLHLFAALQRRPATAPAPAHTGREVLARTRLASQAHDALGVLVTAAEKIHFGGRPAAREDYEACLAHYRRFLDSFERAPS
jgi:hypothetical protein